MELVMAKPRILFILKRRDDYNEIQHSPKGLSTGLFNSANFMVEMLQNLGYEADIQIAIDNNCIDRLVTNYKPTHVIIEALWVVPLKFDILTKLHPDVKWIIRLHSELPFMAGEGIAMDWLGDYITYPQLYIGINAPRMLNEIKMYLKIKANWSEEETEKRIIYMPNFYPQEYKIKKLNRKKHWVDIGCFGAVRPLKNHLVQAFAAIKFAEGLNKQLKFHINAGRIEMKGDPVMHNLRGLFAQLADRGHQLIGHEWTPREEFLQLCSKMDIGMQCNFSETFNIVSADLISQGVPIVGSSEIPWSSNLFNANPTESDDICNMLERTYKHPKINMLLNQRNLTRYTNNTMRIWNTYFKEQ
jgi:hypothetical protein